MLAAELIDQSVDVHVYCDPETRTADLADVTFHDVRSVRRGKMPASSRFGHPLERGSFALTATRALRRDRHLYDLIDVRQTGAWEHDVVTVHGVVKAMQRRWPSEGGLSFRAARLRAAAAPLLWPQIGVDRTIQARQFQRGRFVRLIADTSQVRDDLSRDFGVPPELIDIVHLPIDLERLTCARPSGIRASLGLPAAVPLLLFVGNNFQRKGLDRVIVAFADVSESHLVVVGGGDRSAVESFIRDESVAQRLHFVGPVDEPERFYAEADLVVFPTRSDPWGIPLIEAMAAGVPVITTSAAGASKAVAQSGAGIVLAGTDTAELREAIDTLLRDPARRRAMGERGPQAAEPYGAKAHTAAVLDTYRKTLESAHPRRRGQLVS
jgi:glycosyltransferase involved in cell wall biosynthesis